MSTAGQWDFTLSGASILKTLNTTGGNYLPREQSFTALSMRLVDDKIIYLYERGIYATAVRFEEIGDIDGETPTDLQDAYDKILALILTIFDPADYDLADFQNASADPFVRQSDLTSNGQILGANLWGYRAKTTSNSGDPTSGYLIWDNATQIDSTQINLSHLTAYGFDIDLFFSYLNIGDKLIIQDKDNSTNFQIWNILEIPIINPNSYVEIQVELDSSGGNGTTGFANNHNLMVVRQTVSTQSEPSLKDVLVVGNRRQRTIADTNSIGATDKDAVVVIGASTSQIYIGSSGYGTPAINDETVIVNYLISNCVLTNAIGSAFTISYNGVDYVAEDNIDIPIGSLCFLRYIDTNRFILNIVTGYPNNDVIIPRIKITDKSQQAFTDLESARAWIETFTSATKTNEIFYDGVYAFTVPVGSDFSLADYFCSADSVTDRVSVEDLYGFIGTLGEQAFSDNTENNVLMGNLTFGNNAFKNSIPTIANKIGKLISCGTGFAQNYVGRMDVLFFGTTSGVDLPSDIFTTPVLSWIRTPYSNKFNNSNSPDGDLVKAIGNMTDANSTVIYE